MRGPLGKEDYSPQLSGHETFPLRYGWLKKAFDEVRRREAEGDSKDVFTGDDAIARFGVGKNMVASIRHWATTAGIVKEINRGGHIQCTEFGKLLFEEDNGLDPYMEKPATSWLIHWRLAGSGLKTTWFWAFNHFPALSFEREMLVQSLINLCQAQGWDRASVATVKRDVACFVRTYVRQPVTRQSSYEDVLESPLTELALIKPTGRRDGYRFARGPKPSLGAGVFSYAITDFWQSYSNFANTMSLEALAHEPGSPGRVFLLDENSLVDLLGQVDRVTDGSYTWSETAGLKQLIRVKPVDCDSALDFVAEDYKGA